MSKKLLKNNLGFTLMEVTVTLAIVLIGAVCTIYLFNGISDLKKRSDASDEFELITNEIYSSVSGNDCLEKLALDNFAIASQDTPLTYSPKSGIKFKVISTRMSEVSLAYAKNGTSIFTSILKVSINEADTGKTKDYPLSVVYIQTNSSGQVTACSNVPMVI